MVSLYRGLPHIVGREHNSRDKQGITVSWIFISVCKTIKNRLFIKPVFSF